MKTTNVITIAFFISLSVQIILLMVSNNERFNNLEQNYINRFEPLIKDSIKMHKWYENWEANYSEKNNLKP